MRLCLILFLALSLSACAFERAVEGLADSELESRSLRLEPVLLGSHQSLTSNRSGACGSSVGRTGLTSPEVSQWTADGGVAANGPIVAYSNFLIPGADPAPCNEWQFAVVQAKIVFDLSSIPSGAIIDRAVLKYAIRPVATRSRGFFETTRDCGRADSTFYAEMGTASSVPTGELSTGAPIPYASPATVKWERNPELNVRGRVQTARSSGTVSLLFSPKPTRANQQHDVTASMMGPVVYCASYADDFSLEIDIRVPVSG